VVISVPTDADDRALVTYIPCTTSGRGSRFEVNINAPFLDRPSNVNAQGIATIDPGKFQRRLGVLNASQLAEVEAAVKAWLGLETPPESGSATTP
jgi:mRNA interferase MazF